MLNQKNAIENYIKALENIRIARQNLELFYDKSQIYFICDCFNDIRLTKEQMLLIANPKNCRNKMYWIYESIKCGVPYELLVKLVEEEYSVEETMRIKNLYFHKSKLSNDLFNKIVNKRYGYEYLDIILNIANRIRLNEQQIEFIITSNFEMYDKITLADTLETIRLTDEQLQFVMDTKMDFEVLLVVLNSFGKFPEEYIKYMASQTDIIMVKKLAKTSSYYKNVLRKILNEWKSEYNIKEDIEFVLYNDGKLVIHHPEFDSIKYQRKIKELIPTIKDIVIADLKQKKQKTSQKRDGVYYKRVPYDIAFYDRVPTIDCAQIIDDIKYTPKEFRDVAKYGVCTPHIHFKDLNNSEIDFYESGFDEDVCEIENLLHNFGYSDNNDEEEYIPNKNDLKDILEHFGLK